MLAAPAHCHQGDLVLHQVAERALLSIEQIAVGRSDFAWRPHWNQIGTFGSRRQGHAERAALIAMNLSCGVASRHCAEPSLPPSVNRSRNNNGWR